MAERARRLGLYLARHPFVPAGSLPLYGGFMIVDPVNDRILAGRNYRMTLDEARSWLEQHKGGTADGSGTTSRPLRKTTVPAHRLQR